MFCPSCQQDNSDQAIFCQFCGERFPVAPAPPPQPWTPVTTIRTPPSTPVYNLPSPPSQPTPLQNSSPMQSSPDAGGCAFLAVICGIIFFVFLAAPTPKNRNSRTNYATGSNPQYPNFSGEVKILRPGDPEYERMMADERVREAKRQSMAAFTAKFVMAPKEYPLRDVTPLKRLLKCETLIKANFSADGNLVAGRENSGPLSLWDTRTGQIKVNFSPPTVLTERTSATPSSPKIDKYQLSGMRGLTPSLSPDGKMMAGFDHRGVFLWETATGRCLGRLRGELQNLSTTGWSPDSQLLAVSGTSTTSPEARMEIWNARESKLLQLLERNESSERRYAPAPSKTTLSPRQPFVAGSDNYGALSVWDWKSGSEKWHQSNITSPIVSIVFTPDGRQLATALKTSVALWNAQDGGRYQIVFENEGPLTNLALSPDGHWFAIAGQGGGTIYCGNVKTYKFLPLKTQQEPNSASVLDLAFSNDGKKLQCLFSNGQLLIWQFKQPAQTSAGANSMIHRNRKGDAF